eukprot:159946-Chlamydomonas_euryale.AAC.6
MVHDLEQGACAHVGGREVRAGGGRRDQGTRGDSSRARMDMGCVSLGRGGGPPGPQTPCMKLAETFNL